MAELEVGVLLKRRDVDYKYKVFEVIDFVGGISFVNSMNEELCNIITEGYCGETVEIINDNTFNRKYGVFLFDLDRIIVANDNIVEFSSIREKILKANGKYIFIDQNNHVSILTDRNILKQLESEDKKSKFDEDVFEKNTDISSMYQNIKKTIISQDEQIMQILTALFKNQRVINSDLDVDMIAKLKENLLIYGSTGTGKTEILKRIAKLYKVPLVIEDATSLSETGYAGRNITDMLEDLYAAANGDIKLAEKGILVIDEFDKLAEKAINGNSYVSRSGVQRSLLKLMDGTTFYLKDCKFDTSKLTVIALGAFMGIVEGDDYSSITTDHFITYGIMRELIGRFSKTIPMNALKKHDIVEILKKSDFSPLNTYAKLFEMLNVKFDYTNDFVEYIAELAIKKQSGARSLKIVFDNCISSALFRIFAGEYSSISLIRPKGSDDKAYILTKANKK